MHTGDNTSGNFLLNFNPQTDGAGTVLIIFEVTTDEDSNTYLLVELKRPGAEKYGWEVQVHNRTADLQHKFSVRGGD